jgi:hypothetical protein
MKAVLYHIIIILGSSVLRGINGVRYVISQVVQRLSAWVEPDRAKYYEARAHQDHFLEELTALKETIKMRDAALQSNDWTDESYQRLNYLFNILVQNHNWRKKDVDHYMSCLVESGPEGYAYQVSPGYSEDFDDMEDDYDDEDD